MTYGIEFLIEKQPATVLWHSPLQIVSESAAVTGISYTDLEQVIKGLVGLSLSRAEPWELLCGQSLITSTTGTLPN